MSLEHDLTTRINRLVELLDRAVNSRDYYPPKITKYELARIVSARALQIVSGAPPLVDVESLPNADPITIALKEIEEGKLRIYVERELPNGRLVRRPLDELIEISKELGLL